jgi:hypothetical protein
MPSIIKGINKITHAIKERCVSYKKLISTTVKRPRIAYTGTFLYSCRKRDKKISDTKMAADIITAPSILYLSL